MHHAEDDEQYDGQDDWHEAYMEIHTLKMMMIKYYECDDEWDDTYYGSQADWSPTASECNASEAAADNEWRSSGIKARGRAIAGGLVCLRCGKTGHNAANCKSAPSAASGSSSPATKRPIDLDPMVNMVFQTPSDEFHEVEETYMQGESVVRVGGWVTKEPDMCIQDQGASLFRLGSEYILRYLEWLEVQGYPMDTISFKKCNKSFRFGGDADGHVRWMVELPVHFANASGRIVLGATPMLLGRPVLEQLGAVVDFGSGKMRILGGQWTEKARCDAVATCLNLRRH